MVSGESYKLNIIGDSFDEDEEREKQSTKERHSKKRKKRVKNHIEKITKNFDDCDGECLCCDDCDVCDIWDEDWDEEPKNIPSEERFITCVECNESIDLKIHSMCDECGLCYDCCDCNGDEEDWDNDECDCDDIPYPTFKHWHKIDNNQRLSNLVKAAEEKQKIPARGLRFSYDDPGLYPIDELANDYLHSLISALERGIESPSTYQIHKLYYEYLLDIIQHYFDYCSY